MKTLRLFFVFIILFLLNINSNKAQSGIDSIKLMTYNVGNFGTEPTSSCPLFNFSLKSSYLRTILKYEKPDIIGMAKMNGDRQFCTDTIVNYILDSVCNGCWHYGNYSQLSTYPKENMLYFNTTKFGFIRSTVIYSGDQNISDITLHKLYYKASNLASTHDTVFLSIVLAHLLSGSGSITNRATEVAGAMTWLNSHITGNENLIFMGDFNTTASTEGCFQDLINSTNSNTRFYDPPNQLGNWSGNPGNYALYLTQSTRTTDPGDCNATGGLNNRFDHILITSAIKNGTDSIKYIAGSYKVIGQDGNHTGNALTDLPVNTSVPANVNTALYNMSEHLPVMLNLRINTTVSTGINHYNDLQSLVIIAPNPFASQTTISFSEEQINTTIKITDVPGKEIIKITHVQGKQVLIEKGILQTGIYFIQITDSNNNIINKKIIVQ